MDITLTRAQYRCLLELVYLGNWMVNAIRTDDRVKKYDGLEQYIFSFAEKARLSGLIEFDSELGQFFPTRAFEFESDVERYRGEYDDDVFWEELIYRLARRDLIKHYGEDAVFKMEWDERIAKEQPFLEKYEKEFEERGLLNLEIARMGWDDYWDGGDKGGD
jgi:hypothetical protein